jgi:hypothetical protein
MVFWKGKIELYLPKYTYAPGENITGEINLKLKKSIKARGLNVCLKGVEITTKVSRGADGSSRTKTNRVTLCDIEIPVDGEKEYKEGKYNFELPIPPDALDAPSKADGVLGGVMDAVDFINRTNRRTEWSVKSYLDIPKGFDVSKTQKIVLKK